MLAAWLGLPPDLREAVERLIADLVGLDLEPGRGGKGNGNP